MKTFFPALPLVLLAFVSFGALAACGDDNDGGDTMSLETFLAELASINETSASDSDVIEETLQSELSTVQSEEEALAILDVGIDAFLGLATQVRDDMEALDPPAEVSDLHGELVAVFDVAVAALVGVQDDVARLNVDADPQQVLAEFEGLAEDLTTQFDTLGTQSDLICFLMQDIADENNVDVDLQCGDS